MRVLVVNAGSSSLKLRLLGDADEPLASEDLETPEVPASPPELAAALERLGAPDAVGHRIVHGGRSFLEATVIDAAVEEELRGLSDLAPLHQPKSLAALEAASRALPDVPAVACFDTAFHATLSSAASTDALPSAWRKRWDLRRFGFHGLSHAYVARRVRELFGGSSGPLRIVSCHLSAPGHPSARFATGARSTQRWALARLTGW